MADDLVDWRYEFRQMHRRAQKAEGKLARVTNFLTHLASHIDGKGENYRYYWLKKWIEKATAGNRITHSEAFYMGFASGQSANAAEIARLREQLAEAEAAEEGAMMILTQAKAELADMTRQRDAARAGALEEVLAGLKHIKRHADGHWRLGLGGYSNPLDAVETVVRALIQRPAPTSGAAEDVCPTCGLPHPERNPYCFCKRAIAEDRT